MDFLPWVLVGFTIFLIVIKFLVTPPKKKSYEQELFEYKQSNYYRQTKYDYNRVASDPGLLGEYEMSRRLERYVQEGAKFLYNLYVPRKDHFTEVDMVMIHTTGVYVFESKNMSGKITGSDSERMWTQKTAGKKFSFYNPLWQNDKHASAIQHLVGEDVNVHPLVVFNPDCTLKVTYQSQHKHIVTWKQLDKTVQQILLYGYTPMTKTRVNEIYKQLKEYADASEEQKRMHDSMYEQVECPVCRLNFPVFVFNIPQGSKYEIMCPECETRLYRRKE